MRTPIYSTAIKQAWNLTLHHKILWIFGLLAAFLGQFGLGDFLGNLWRETEGQTLIPQLFSNIHTPNLSATVGLIWSIGIVLALALFLYIAAIIAQGALIAASAEWFKKEKIETTEKLWHKGVEKFWPLLGTNVLRHASLILLALIFGFAWTKIMSANLLLIGTLLHIVLLAVALFLAVVVSSVTIYAAGYVVIDKTGFLTSLKKGFKLLEEHLLVSLELSIILVLLSLTLILVIAAGAAVLLIPFLGLWFIGGLTGMQSIAIFGALASLVLFVTFVVLSGAIFNTFYTSAWMMLFLKMHKTGIVSRIMKFFSKKIKR